MALVKFGGGVVDARGSIGGTTFSRNRFGNYMRARKTPVNPQSPRQSAIRAIVASVNELWNGSLTQANRDSWEVYGSNVPATNKLGEVIRLPGFNQFNKTSIAAVNAGNTPIFAAPLVFTLPGEDTLFTAAVDAGTGKITITFDDARDWLNENAGLLIVEMGIPQNASRNFFDGPWRHAGVINGNLALPPTTPAATIDVPFAVGDGQKVFVRAKIMRGDGRLSDWFRFNSIVATA